MAWLLIALIGILWLIGVMYLLTVFYFKITQKEVFVPFVPADTEGIETMYSAIGLKGSERVVDIGSGWGTILFHLHKKFPTLYLTGIELNPVLHVITLLRKFLFHRKGNIRLLRGDAATISYSDYDVIFLFMLSPFVNKVLVPKFEKELKKGTKVVSYVFKMKSNAFSEKTVKLPSNGWKSAVYIYEKL